MLSPLRTVAIFALSTSLIASAIAQPSVQAVPDVSTPTVFTRARVTSFHQEAGDKLYVRLKLLPRSKIPFATQTFRVTDRSLVAGISEGAWVKFTSKRMDGENVVTSIHTTPECQRFQKCD